MPFLFSEAGINFTCLSKYLTIYEGGRFIYKDTQNLSDSQNQFTETSFLFTKIVILFTEIVKKIPAYENGFTEVDILIYPYSTISINRGGHSKRPSLKSIFTYRRLKTPVSINSCNKK